VRKSTVPDDPDETSVSEYVNEHRDFLSRVLRHGNNEARSYALALLANGGTDDDLEAVQEELKRLQNGEE
jgi:hypothetical protein